MLWKLPNLGGVACDAGLSPDVCLRGIQQRRWVAASLGHDTPCQAVWLLQQRLHQMLRLHDLLRVLLGDVWRRCDRLLEA